MAENKKYYHNLDVERNKVMNLLLNPLTDVQRAAIGAALGLADQGYVCYDTTLNQEFFWDGTQWIAQISGSGIPTQVAFWGTNTSLTSDAELYWDNNNKRLGIGIASPQTRLHVGNGGGSMGFPYEEAIIERNGDTKFGVYTSVTSPSYGGASYVLGYTNFLTNLGYYPGFEFQMVTNATDADNFIRYNFLQRNSSGTVAAANADIFNIYADSRASFKTLIGTGNRMVIADANGFISTQNITVGTVTNVTATSPLFSSGGATPNITIQQASGSQAGYLSSADWTTFNNKQNTISLTTTGTSGAATFIGGTLNIPQYQSVLTNPVTGTGVATRVAFWDTTSSISSDLSLYWDNTNKRLGIGTATPAYKLDVNGTGRFTGLLAAEGDFYAGAAGSSQFDINTLSATIPYTLGIWRKFGNGNYTYFKEDEQGGAQHKWAFVQRGGFDQTRAFYQANSSILNINLGWQDPNSNNYDGNTLLINPKINITSTLITGTKIRGIYYNPTLTSIVNTTHIGFENTTG
jgi:hypothetical protein